MPKDLLTTALEAALEGLDYPAPRAKLLTFVYMNSAFSRDVVNRLLELPETADFLNEEELRRTLGATVPGLIHTAGNDAEGSRRICISAPPDRWPVRSNSPQSPCLRRELREHRAKLIGALRHPIFVTTQPLFRKVLKAEPERNETAADAGADCRFVINRRITNQHRRMLRRSAVAHQRLQRGRVWLSAEWPVPACHLVEQVANSESFQNPLVGAFGLLVNTATWPIVRANRTTSAMPSYTRVCCSRRVS